ncbi:AAA family ATPase [Micromonospora sp. NPDC049900]|uniref:AAA family ATPase n=1 Tax=Micromonospora sp. NPDC049900 TaxID=3364275 RepID=UPI0037AF4D85
MTIFYGPLSWFDKQLGNRRYESFPEIVHARDEADRQIKVSGPNHSDAEPNGRQPERPKRVVAESSDYASLREHAITNFSGLIRSINPKHLYLHNPPTDVHAQLKRTHPTKVKRYEYPAVPREMLIHFRDGFADNLVGQTAARDRVLAALYPLTTQRRTKPVVLMFYGPSGVGKTETAQFVNRLLNGTLLRKQLSMFHNDKFASYLFGGAHSESSFAKDLLDRESGVILIDEFDKANAVFHSAFYEIFDSGVFEDKNYRVRLGASLIICTSNYGSEKEIQEALGDALYSRFDSLIRFNQLSRDEILQVIDRLVDCRFADLAPEEQKRLDPSETKSFLHPLADKFANVRKLGKYADEVISLQLVRTLLDEQPSLETGLKATA